MASELVWTELALSDLDQVVAYIADDSPEAAAAFAADVDRKANSLLTMPEAGSPVVDLDVPDLREIFVGKYRMIYRVVEPDAVILAFVHGARDLPSLWDSDQRDST